MDVEPVDLGDELRQRVELRLARPPVVVGAPVARELLHQREGHALRIVGDRLALGPPGRVDAPAQVGELRLRNTDFKGPNRGLYSNFNRGQVLSLSSCGRALTLLLPLAGRKTHETGASSKPARASETRIRIRRNP